MKISIIGQGYVGQTLAVGAAMSGHEVIGLDINAELISNLRRGDSFVPGLDKNLISEIIAKKVYLPTTDFELMKGSKIVVIAVPTPIDENREPDLNAVLAACKSINKVIIDPTLVISESTSYPGTLRGVIKPTVEKASKTTFRFAVAPERVDPGNQNWNISNTTRVISGLTNEATDQAIEFYSSFCKNIYRASSPEVAEAAKLLENTFRQVNIALINEVSEVMSKLGISANEVVNAASTKPFGFMKFQPSIGVGGHCIPVDPEYLTFFAKKVGGESKLTNLANEINLQRPKQIAQRIQKYLGGDLTGIRIQIAGIAYKTGVPDMRESPAVELITELNQLGAVVSWHDPVVKEFMAQKSCPLDPSINLGLIVTPHSEIIFKPWEEAGTPVIDLSVGPTNLGWPKYL
jgi:UDP-N-acetyl-D-glucosamine dehydrogenase